MNTLQSSHPAASSRRCRDAGPAADRVLLGHRPADLLRAVGEGGVLRHQPAGDVVRLQVDEGPELRDRVRAMVRARVADVADADDIVQDVVERVLRRRDQLRDPARRRLAGADRAQRRRRPLPPSAPRRRRRPGDVRPGRAAFDDAERLASGRCPACISRSSTRSRRVRRGAPADRPRPAHAGQTRRRSLGVSTSGMKSRVQRGRRLLEAAAERLLRRRTRHARGDHRGRPAAAVALQVRRRHACPGARGSDGLSPRGRDRHALHSGGTRLAPLSRLRARPRR